MEKKTYKRNIFILLLAILLILSALIIMPLMDSILAALVMAVLLWPLHNWLKQKIRSDFWSAMIIVILVLLVATVPMAIMLNSLIDQVRGAVDFVKDEFSDEGVFEWSCEGRENALCQSYNDLAALFPGVDIDEVVRNLRDWLIQNAREALSFFTSGIFFFFVSLYILFFLLLDGPRLVKFVKDSLSMKKSYERYVERTLLDTIYGVVFGSLVIAFLQGAVAAIGYWLIGGLEGSLLLGLITVFFALIPNIGTPIVWAPVSVYVISMGIINDDGSQLFRGIALFAYGALVISTIDNILKPKVIGDRAKIHPVVVLIGVLGGLQLMGFIGIMMGPLILALATSFVKLLRLEVRNL